MASPALQLGEPYAEALRTTPQFKTAVAVGHAQTLWGCEHCGCANPGALHKAVLLMDPWAERVL